MKRRFFVVAVAALAGAVFIPAQVNPFDVLKNVLKSNPAPAQSKTSTDTWNAATQMVKARAGIGPEQEKVVGASVAFEIVAKYGGLVRDPAMMHRVNLIGRSLARYSDRPDADHEWRFGVLNSDTINAFSAPDGWVFITRGLYVLAKSDDALAGVLGHEITHITGRHSLQIVEGADFWSGAANVVVSRSSDARAFNNALQQLGQGVGKITATLFEKGYAPDTEYQADRGGHDLAKVTGYAPGGMRSVLVLLQQRGGDPKKVFATHPPLNDRIRRLPDEPAPKL